MRTQLPVSILLTYASYLAWVCPCEKTLSCHLNEFYGATLLAVALVGLENM